MKNKLLLGSVGKHISRHGLSRTVSSLLEKKESAWRNHFLMHSLTVVNDLLFAKLFRTVTIRSNLHIAK